MRISPKHAIRAAGLTAALALPVGAVALTAGSAGAATATCATHCTDVSFAATPGWLVNDSKGRETGNLVVSQQLGASSGNQGRNEDYYVADHGTVDGGPLPASLAYAKRALDAAGLGSDQVVQLEYSPYGEDSGLCIGAWNGAVPRDNWLTRNRPCYAPDTYMVEAGSANIGFTRSFASGSQTVTSASALVTFPHTFALTNAVSQAFDVSVAVTTKLIAAPNTPTTTTLPASDYSLTYGAHHALTGVTINSNYKVPAGSLFVSATVSYKYGTTAANTVTASEGHYLISADALSYAYNHRGYSLQVLSNNGIAEWQNLRWTSLRASGLPNQEVLTTPGPFTG